MKKYKTVQTLKYELEDWIHGKESNTFEGCKASEWGVLSIVPLPETSWLIVTIYQDIKNETL